MYEEENDKGNEKNLIRKKVLSALRIACIKFYLLDKSQDVKVNVLLSFIRNATANSGLITFSKNKGRPGTYMLRINQLLRYLALKAVLSNVNKFSI
jgi:hypothetical protein